MHFPDHSLKAHKTNQVFGSPGERSSVQTNPSLFKVWEVHHCLVFSLHVDGGKFQPNGLSTSLFGNPSPGMVLLNSLSITEGRHIVAELKILLLRATFMAFPKDKPFGQILPFMPKKYRRALPYNHKPQTGDMAENQSVLKSWLIPTPMQEACDAFLAWPMQRPVFLPGHCPCCPH